jgi:hypothetical protein
MKRQFIDDELIREDNPIGISMESDEEMEFDTYHHFQFHNKKTGDVLLDLRYQKGGVKNHGVNGINSGDVIMAEIIRLRAAQNGQLSCKENAMVITHLEAAMLWNNKRADRRVKELTEGTNKGTTKG